MRAMAVMMAAPEEQRAQGGRLGYIRLSQSKANSLVMIVPLLLVYEGGMLLLNAAVGPGMSSTAAADIFKGPLSYLGMRAALTFNLMIVAAFILAAVNLEWRNSLRPWFFPVMLGEACLYAAALTPLTHLMLTGSVTRDAVRLPTHVSAAAIVIAAGAGVYEELLFRGLLLGLLYLIARRAFELKPVLSGIIAIVVASGIFSLMHLLGPLGEAFATQAFWFRLVAGVMLSVVFLTRGMAIACYTHAIYNMIALGLLGA